ncbi:MAG: hypothetical protein ACTSPA_06290 [Promethearchaeota archaeon]
MKEKTKKNILQACLGFYWGFNLIALLIYEIFMWIFSRDKSTKNSSDEAEYAKIFWYLISIPFISIVVLIFFSKVGFIYLFPIFNVVYGAGIVTTAAILIFSKDSIYIFDKKEGEFLSNYKDFGNVLLMDIVWQIISVIIGYIYFEFYISHIFIAIFLSWGFYRFKKTYSGEKKTRKDKKDHNLLLEFSSKSPLEMEQNIHQVQKLAIDAIKSNDLNLAEIYLKNSTKKIQKSIEQFRKKYPSKSSQFKSDFFKSKSLLDTISKLKIALKTKNQKEIKKYKSKMRHLMEQLI